MWNKESGFNEHTEKFIGTYHKDGNPDHMWQIEHKVSQDGRELIICMETQVGNFTSATICEWECYQNGHNHLIFDGCQWGEHMGFKFDPETGHFSEAHWG